MTTEENNRSDHPEPPQELAGDPLFDAILGAIMQWDFSRFDDGMYAEATNNDARSIYDAIKAVLDKQQAELVGWTTKQEMAHLTGVAEGDGLRRRFAFVWRDKEESEAIPLYASPSLPQPQALVDHVERLTAERNTAVKAAYERAAQRCDDGADNLEACPPNVRTDAAIDALRFKALEIRAMGRER